MDISIDQSGTTSGTGTSFTFSPVTNFGNELLVIQTFALNGNTGTDNNNPTSIPSAAGITFTKIYGAGFSTINGSNLGRTEVWVAFVPTNFPSGVTVTMTNTHLGASGGVLLNWVTLKNISIAGNQNTEAMYANTIATNFSSATSLQENLINLATNSQILAFWAEAQTRTYTAVIGTTNIQDNSHTFGGGTIHLILQKLNALTGARGTSNGMKETMNTSDLGQVAVFEFVGRTSGFFFKRKINVNHVASNATALSITNNTGANITGLDIPIGSLVVVEVAIDGRSGGAKTVSSITDDAGNSYVLDKVGSNSTSLRCEIWHSILTTKITSGQNITVNLSGTNAWDVFADASAVIFASNVHQPDSVANSSGASSPTSSGNLTNNNNTKAIFFGISDSVSFAPTVGGSYTLIDSGGGSTDTSFGYATGYREVEAQTTAPFVTTYNSGNIYASCAACYDESSWSQVNQTTLTQGQGAAQGAVIMEKMI